MGRLLGGNRWHSVTILGRQAAKHIKHLRGFTNRLTDVAQCVGKALELSGVGGDVHVALDDGPELRVKVDGVMEFVVTELIMDRVPDGMRPRPRRTHNRAESLEIEL